MKQIKFSKLGATAFYQGDAMGKAIVYCEQVMTGAKLVSEIGIHKKHKRIVAKIVNDNKLKVIWYEYEENGNYISGYIFKYQFVRTLIHQAWLSNADPDKKPTALEVWHTGKLFGYSDHEIAKYLKKHNLIER